MPIYEYLCTKCAQVSEVLQKFSDPPLSQCPLCGGKVKKLMSHNSFQLKGGGWYATDHRKPAPADTADKKEVGGENPVSGETQVAEPAPAPPSSSEAESTAGGIEK
jgi:putative FmdB family regulatory protein